jgi:predicted aspartyl protease
LSFLFNGMVLYSGEDDRLQVAQVPWSCVSRWRMPVDAWKRVMAAYYPGGGWVRLETETLEALAARKARDGHHSFDALVAELLR